MARFRLKPAEVDAVQWFQPGDHPDVRPYSPQGITAMLYPAGTHLLHTGLRTVPVVPGDWIVTSANGSLSLCKPDAFAAAFEPLTDDGG